MATSVITLCLSCRTWSTCYRSYFIPTRVAIIRPLSAARSFFHCKTSLSIKDLVLKYVATRSRPASAFKTGLSCFPPINNGTGINPLPWRFIFIIVTKNEKWKSCDNGVGRISFKKEKNRKPNKITMSLVLVYSKVVYVQLGRDLPPLPAAPAVATAETHFD